MSDVFTRTDRSHIARWWWTVDRWTLVALAVLIGFGLLLVSAASTQIAERLNHQTFYFVEHQAFMLIPTVAVMFGVSLLGPRDIRRLALITLGIFLALTFATFFIGTEIKGATRWITLGPLSLQPSEFVKPAFAVVSAWLFARQHTARAAGQTFHGNAAAIVLLLLVIAVLMAQPDFGMTFVCAAIWFAEFFLAGLPIVIVLGVAVLGVGLLVGAYYLSPHVALRVHMFLDGNAYQVKRSIAAFVHGGLTGTGPGQGTVKLGLPDAHADFIFAVAGEELGLAATLLLVALFGFIVLRGFSRAMKDNDLFIVLAVGGLFTQFGLQALIHMGSALNLLPAKGMTLPFISYGGSSLLALGLGTGMALALTRARTPGSDSQ